MVGVMKLRLDLLLPAILIATAGSELVAPDAFSADQLSEAVCSRDDSRPDPSAEISAKRRILAEGYSDVRILSKSCDDNWHALALADGDPVAVRVTPDGAVLTE